MLGVASDNNSKILLYFMLSYHNIESDLSNALLIVE